MPRRLSLKTKSMEKSSVLDSELNRYLGEKKASESHIIAEQETYKNKILGGLGKEIEDYLDNPPKPKAKNKIISKIKRWIRF